MSRTPHDSLEMMLTCVHIGVWVDEGIENRLCRSKDLCNIVPPHVTIARCLAILLLKQDSRDGLPFAEEKRLRFIWIISFNKAEKQRNPDLQELALALL